MVFYVIFGKQTMYIFGILQFLRILKIDYRYIESHFVPIHIYIRRNTTEATFADNMSPLINSQRISAALYLVTWSERLEKMYVVARNKLQIRLQMSHCHIPHVAQICLSGIAPLGCDDWIRNRMKNLLRIL